MGWREDEKAFVRKHLPRKGHRWCAKRLGKQPSTVWAWANKNGIRFGDLPGYRPAAEVARECDVYLGTIIRRADAAGASKRLGRRTRGRHQGAARVLVRKGWAKKLIAEYDERGVGEFARANGFLNRKEAQALWRLGKGTLIRGFHGEGLLAPLLEGAEILRGKSGAWLIDPEDAERIGRQLEAQRELAKRLISTKSLAIEYGLNPGEVARYAKSIGGQLLLSGGRLGCFVSEGQAAQIKAHYRVDLPEPPSGWTAVAELARDTRVSTQNILGWARAKKRQIPLRWYRHPHNGQPSWWVSTEDARRYRAFRRARSKLTRQEG